MAKHAERYEALPKDASDQHQARAEVARSSSAQALAGELDEASAGLRLFKARLRATTTSSCPSRLSSTST
eukprot:15431395-Alexandrium_andersonii.AAC.1